MAYLNKVLLIGRLGADPEIRSTQTGAKVATFRMAVSRWWKNADGERQEATEWINIESWGRLAELCENYLNKGRLIYIEGRLQTDQYERDGERRYFTKVVTRDIQILEGKSVETEGAATDIDEEEVPF